MSHYKEELSWLGLFGFKFTSLCIAIRLQKNSAENALVIKIIGNCLVHLVFVYLTTINIRCNSAVTPNSYERPFHEPTIEHVSDDFQKCH